MDETPERSLLDDSSQAVVDKQRSISFPCACRLASPLNLADKDAGAIQQFGATSDIKRPAQSEELGEVKSEAQHLKSTKV